MYQHKNNPSKVSACCICSLPSWLLVGMRLLAWCNCSNHYYFSGLLQVQQTAQMVGYCYNKYKCWSGASVSDICINKFTDTCWLHATVKDMRNGQNSIVTDMADGRVQM